MWIFFNDAFLSVVADKADPHGPRLLVRARREGDIERVFPEADTTTTLHADYRYRAWLPREQVIEALRQQVESLAYTNFKNSIADDEHDYHEAAMRVWHVMYRYQDDTFV